MRVRFVLPLRYGLPIAAGLLILWWFVLPLAAGYHVGCSSSFGDNVRLVRLGVQFCKHDPNVFP